ncbi:MAG: YihY/virulence factor BrkB family protein [Pseudooceanicola sp.]
MADTADRGHRATAPTGIPPRGWKDVALRVKDEVARDHVSVVSAGVAFFGLLAIFPAIGALISVAGFVLDPEQVAAQIDSVLTLLPENAAAIIQNQIEKVTGADETATGLAALLGLALALYGAMKGVLTLMEGLNIAYDETETRGYVRLYLTALGLTLMLILGVLGAVGVMLVWPVMLDLIPMPETLRTWGSILQWPVLAVLAVLGLGVIYRIGPSRADARWRWISPGAVAAMILWLLGTLAFTFYASNFGSYNETYGTIGGVIVLLTWLWLSSFIVLAGAELNAELEQQTIRDTTTGAPRPMGERGAEPADTPPPGMERDTSPARDGDLYPLRREDDLTRLELGLIAGRALWLMARRRRRRASEPAE